MVQGQEEPWKTNQLGQACGKEKRHMWDVDLCRRLSWIIKKKEHWYYWHPYVFMPPWNYIGGNRSRKRRVLSSGSFFINEDAGQVHLPRCHLPLLEVCPWLGSLIKEYQRITEDSTPFLSRWHGKTHAWYCQALWLGHWKANSAVTLGEEQEQGFAYFSSLALKTKRMDRESRRDSMSSSILYFDAKKNRKIASTLTKRLKKA